MTCLRTARQAVVGMILEPTFLTIDPFSWLPRSFNKTQPLAKDLVHGPDLGSGLLT